MANLLVVEDDYDTNEAISEYMKMVGHSTLSAFDGVQAIITLQENNVDLVILDIMLPKKDGISVLKEIRENSSITVLVLTAIENEHTQVSCFDAEVDDYITKPFSMILLEKRVKALLRRSGKNCDVKQLQINDIVVDFAGYTAKKKDNEKIDLTPKEFDLLKLLVEHKGLVLTRNQIIDDLWGYGYPIADRIIDTYIKNLRKKLDIDNIITVKGVGYKYEEII